jgi:hypothetical protein
MIFNLTRDTLTPDLKRKLKRLENPRPVIEAGAKAIQVEIKRHLRDLQSRGNEMGWPSQGFFARGRNAVEKHVGIAKLTDKGALITIADPRFVHRILGGTVTAKRGRLLAIPLRAEAYRLAGKGTIRESAPHLKLVVFPKGVYLIEEAKHRKGSYVKADGAGGTTRFIIKPWFKLVPRVTHRPHPDEAPREDALSAAASSAMTRAVDLLLVTGS